MEGRDERFSGTASTCLPTGTTSSGTSGSDLSRRWNEARLLLSLSVVPGAAHVYTGHLARGIIWSCVFLFVVLPLSFLLLFASALDETALFWILVGAGTFLLLGGLGPAVRAFRGPAPRPGERRRTGVVAVYACAVVLAVLAESGWFVFRNLSTVSVASTSLEPIAHQGEEMTVLLSRFTRPVHGEVILFALASGPESPGGAPRRGLGRVIAVPRDAVTLQNGEVFVNEIRIDFERTDQRRALEKAGRRLRRKRLLSDLFLPANDLPAVRDYRIPLAGEDRTFVLPPDAYLVAPDVPLPAGDPREVGPSGERQAMDDETRRTPWIPTAWIVDRADVLGRGVPSFPW